MIVIIALTQFTVVLDFMVMSPLGDMLIKEMNITPFQFGVVVAAYAFSAGISGILSAGFADKFDRKKLFLFFYAGFVIGTLLCGLAPNYEMLVAARIFTGLFGGVIGAVAMAIITDLFALEQRGRVIGFTQMAFAASQVMGIPISLVIANKWGWNAPFLMIVAFAVVFGILIIFTMKPVTGHLGSGRQNNVLQHLLSTLMRKKYQTGFITTALLSIGGFMMMPFGAAFAINNLGVSQEQLFMVYMATGFCSVIIMPVIGTLSDKFDKLRIFQIGSAWAIIVVLIYTSLGTIPLWLVITSNILLFAGIMSRMVPSTALMSAVPDLKDRGAFMSINSSLSQLAGGIAAVCAGWIVVQPTPNSPLQNFDVVGYVVAVLIVATMYGMIRVNNLIRKEKKTTVPIPTSAAA
jgi:predicted MFS family arabinose efflux permease